MNSVEAAMENIEVKIRSKFLGTALVFISLIIQNAGNSFEEPELNVRPKLDPLDPTMTHCSSTIISLTLKATRLKKCVLAHANLKKRNIRICTLNAIVVAMIASILVGIFSPNVLSMASQR
ncbi:hypothetical protein GGR53DRAFT_469096 [Hypoxylon sp. FL1150]|nr:hypothetical protein GGR53DRAFT_469096 [Hypoxylon sp. FL1150]